MQVQLIRRKSKLRVTKHGVYDYILKLVMYPESM